MESRQLDTIFFLGDSGELERHDIAWGPVAGDWPEMAYPADEPPELLPVGDHGTGIFWIMWKRKLY